MTITVNDEPRELRDDATVETLLSQESEESKYMVSIVLNDVFVRAEEYAQTPLKDGDSVSFLYFMGGGA